MAEPSDSLRGANRRLMGFLGRRSSERSDDWPRCDHCGLPGVCFGADLAYPKHRCPRCCREYPQFGGSHGPEDYMGAHAASEGVAL